MATAEFDKAVLTLYQQKQHLYSKPPASSFITINTIAGTYFSARVAQSYWHIFYTCQSKPWFVPLGIYTTGQQLRMGWHMGIIFLETVIGKKVLTVAYDNLQRLRGLLH